MIRRIATIAFHTFKESVRDKVLYNLVAFALILIGAAVLMGSISVGINDILLVNLGLSAISVFGLLIAIFIGISLVWKEIERRTIYSILSKPVARAEFIVGKYFGLLLTLIINTGIMTAGFYVALAFQKRGLGAGDVAPLEAVCLILLELAVVVGLALMFSSISTPVLSALFTFSLFAAGNFLDDLKGLGRESGSAIVQGVLDVIYYLLPNFGDFNHISAAAHGVTVPGYWLISRLLYALLYVTVLVSATILIFEEREFR